MSTTSTTTAVTAATAVAATPTKLQKIGLIVELCGGGAFLAGTVLSIHHYAVGAFFVGGAAAFFVGRKLHES
jgi:hypothetical protein